MIVYSLRFEHSRSWIDIASIQAKYITMGSIEDTATTPPPAGVWCPAITLFNPDTDEIDHEAQAKYYSYLSKSGLAGLVIGGTNAETFLLTREERKALIQTARSAVGPSYPLMAGCGGHSTKQTLEYIQDAFEAGANTALVLPAAYFGKATTPSVIQNYYNVLALKSPLPIIIYNFPGVTNGIDLDSTTITNLANAHPTKILGVKLTCASVGKITRLAASLPSTRFSTFGGQSDFLIGGLSVGSAGAIAAFANIFPKTVSKIYSLYKSGKIDEALKLHQEAALAEQGIKSGIAVTKYAVSLFSARDAGIKVEVAERLCRPRQPYEEPGEAAKEGIRKCMQRMGEIEREL